MRGEPLLGMPALAKRSPQFAAFGVQGAAQQGTSLALGQSPSWRRGLPKLAHGWLKARFRRLESTTRNEYQPSLDMNNPKIFPFRDACGIPAAIADRMSRKGT